MNLTLEILTRDARGDSVPTIAAALGIPRGRVYAILRQNRPGGGRKPRRPTSDKPAVIRGLLADGWTPARIVAVLGVTRQYVSACKKRLA